ncbi:MAG: hypothetical protein K0U76_00855 [Actinomycetia bacterium]|nr:hypothetical protein [Actinomycetes bacterium]MCH9699933.1 hypothetical protein [Actinomycetes bacterium]MCH9759613.1 hypothetical protein [Actinomycetes bacterium]
MKAPMTTLAALLVAGGASLAVAAAPTALAQPNCEQTEVGGGFAGGSTTVCQSPGNVQIDTRPSVLAPGAMGGFFPWGYGMFIL